MVPLAANSDAEKATLDRPIGLLNCLVLVISLLLFPVRILNLMLCLILIHLHSLSLSLSLFLLFFILCISFRSYHLSIVLPFYRCIYFYLSAEHVRLLIHHLLIYPIDSSIGLCVCSHLSTFLSIFLLSISFYHFYLSTHLSSSAYLSVPMNIYLSIELSISVYGLASMHPSIHPPGQTAIHLFWSDLYLFYRIQSHHIYDWSSLVRSRPISSHRISSHLIIYCNENFIISSGPLHWI